VYKTQFYRDKDNYIIAHSVTKVMMPYRVILANGPVTSHESRVTSHKSRGHVQCSRATSNVFSALASSKPRKASPVTGLQASGQLRSWLVHHASAIHASCMYAALHCAFTSYHFTHSMTPSVTVGMTHTVFYNMLR